MMSTFRCLEMHSTRRYKICICSVIPGALESSRNCKGFSIIFPKILDAIGRITKVRNFLISLSIAFLSPKIFNTGIKKIQNWTKLSWHHFWQQQR